MKVAMLVDDDPFFHSTFLSCADWERLDCTVAFQAYNGSEALTVLTDNHVDIVFSDMVMPGMTGVDLIKIIHLTYPSIRCFALSNFDEFEYVRQSLKNGAEDYILKHMLSQKVLGEILSNRSGEEIPGNTANVFSKKVFEEAFLAEIKCETATGSSFSRLIKDYNYVFPELPVLLAVIQVKDVLSLFQKYQTEERLAQFYATAVNIILNTVDQYGPAFCVSNSCDTMYLAVSNANFTSRLYLEKTIELIERSIPAILNRYCGISVRSSSTGCLESADEIPMIFRKIEREMEHGPDSLTSGYAGAVFPGLNEVTLQSLEENLTRGNPDILAELITAEFQKCKECAPYMEPIQSLCTGFVNHISGICNKKSIRQTDIFPFQFSPSVVISHLKSCNEMTSFIVAAYQNLQKKLRNSDRSDNLIVMSAIEYIRKNYRQDLSLSGVAEYCHCNTTYLSRIFKCETGKGFVQYLNDFRMERVLLMMEQQIAPIKDLSEMVGFPNYNYFFKLFKKYTGMTPQAYLKARHNPVN